MSLKMSVVLACVISLSFSTFAGEKQSWSSPFVKDIKNSKYKDRLVKGNDIESRGLKWGDLKPNDLGPRVNKYDYSMQNQMRKFPKLPKPGAHPRILFTTEQIPDLRRRLKTTKPGKHMWKAIIGWTEALKGRYDNDAYYAKPDRFKGSFGMRGFIPMFRAGALKKGEVWKKLIAGDNDFSGYKSLGKEWGIFPLEALRCLIEEDEEGGKLLGKAVDTCMQAYHSDPKKGTKDSPWGKWGLSGFNVAYTYDIAHKWLSPKTKKLMRDHMLNGSNLHDHYGSFQAYYATSSNWVTFTYALICLTALEGEEGFNDLKYLGILRAFKNFYSYGWYPSGACYEGMGKNQLGGDALLMFAMRGENVAAHPNALNTYLNRMPKDVIPGDSKFIAYGRWGGPKNIPTMDIMALKYLYPKNKKIDWAYKRAIGENCENIGGGRLMHYWNGILIQSVLIEEPLENSISQEEAAEGKKTFFCPDRNLMITRSDWSDDALYMHSQTRPANGGHVFADRGSFTLYGKGESWLIKRPIAYLSEENNMVLIDGRMHSAGTPGRVVDFQDNDNASFVVSDTKYTWDWEVVGRGTWQTRFGVKNNPKFRFVDGGEFEPMLETANDFSYADRKDDYLNMPIHKQQDWHGFSDDEWRMDAKRPLVPVEKSFRTTGMVRGAENKPSYALIMDDMKVDGKKHKYEWMGQFDINAVLWKSEESETALRPTKPFTRDLIFFKRPYKGGGHVGDIRSYDEQEKPKNGQAMVLVRFVDMNKSGAFSDSFKFENIAFEQTKINTYRRKRSDNPKVARINVLTVTSESVAPNFKVLVYPFRNGVDKLPETKWVGSKLQVSWPDSGISDTLEFNKSKQGKVDLKITRAGKTIANVNRKPTPSPDRKRKVNLADLKIPDAVKAWDFSSDEGLTFSKGKYSKDNASIIDGVLTFDRKGHQQVSLPDIELPSKKNFTIAFKAKSFKNGPCAMIGGNGWSFALGHWHATNLKVLDKFGGVRHTKEKIQNWFVDNWANVAIVKSGLSWRLYVNGQLKVILKAEKKLPAGPLKIQFGNAAGSVHYGMQGKVDSIKVFDKALTLNQLKVISSKNK